MKFNGIGHYDNFDDEVIFWTEISNLPKHIQDEAKIIDGDEYSENCFGICVDYNFEHKKFNIITDTDMSTGDNNNVYYIDNNGDKYWFKTEIPEGIRNQIFSACNEIMDQNSLIATKETHTVDEKPSVLKALANAKEDVTAPNKHDKQQKSKNMEH